MNRMPGFDLVERARALARLISHEADAIAAQPGKGVLPALIARAGDDQPRDEREAADDEQILKPRLRAEVRPPADDRRPQ